MVTRISAPDAAKRVESGHALLICAYADDQKCRDADVSGSITYRQFEAQLPNLPKNRELIFFCA